MADSRLWSVRILGYGFLNLRKTDSPELFGRQFVIYDIIAALSENLIRLDCI